MKERQEQPHTPYLDEINDMFDDYQKDLGVRSLHLKLLPVFPTAELDDLISLLKEPYHIDLTKKKE